MVDALGILPYALAAASSGTVSILGRIPSSRLKARVSSLGAPVHSLALRLDEVAPSAKQVRTPPRPEPQLPPASSVSSLWRFVIALCIGVGAGAFITVRFHGPGRRRSGFHSRHRWRL